MVTTRRRRKALPRRAQSRAQRRINSARPSSAAAMALSKFLRDKLERFEKEIERLLFPSLIDLAPEEDRSLVMSVREDVRIPSSVAAKLQAIELHLVDIFDERDLDRGLEVIGKRISTKNATELQRVIGISIREAAPGVAAQIDNFRAITVQRIKTLAGTELVEITKLLDASEATGARVEVLSKAIQQRFKVTKSRGDLLARDQTLTLNAQIARTRQTNAGITDYVWTTSGDERVRTFEDGDTDHAMLDGQTFNWNTPPDVGDGRRLHPGEDFQCRCTASPVLPELA